MTLTLTANTEYPEFSVGSPSSITLTIRDDDVPAVSIAPVTSPVTEGTAATFTLTASPAPYDDRTVNLSWNRAASSFVTGALPPIVTIGTDGTGSRRAGRHRRGRAFGWRTPRRGPP